MKKEEEKQMKNKTLLLTIAAGSLITGSAMADYTELSFDGVDNGDGTWTARIYANYSDAADELHAVFGDADNALVVDSTGGFYQATLFGAHWNTSVQVNEGAFGGFPEMMTDSWVTIGADNGTGNELSTSPEFDFGDFEMGGAISTDNGAWYLTPGMAQGVAGSDLRVLLGQFTMIGADSYVTGVFNLQGSDGQSRDQTFNYSMVPAPGALALLGLAGVASRRRRK
jgi:hypothetical protein